MGWTDYRAAPAPGTPICPAAEVEGVRALTLRTGRGEFPLLVLRAGGAWRAYVNACPHQYLPLDHRGGELLSADGTKLLCSNHGARFDILTGVAVGGTNCGLDAVPVVLRDGMLVVGENG